MAPTSDPGEVQATDADWQRRVVGRSLKTAAERSVDRGRSLIQAAATVLARSGGEDITVQEVADEAGQSLRTLYQYFESKDDLLLALFEEAMRTYAQLIERAIADLVDPLDRLAGAVVAAVRLPELHDAGVDRGLVRLRLKLSESQPDLVGRAQVDLASLVRSLVGAAAESGQIGTDDPDSATFVLLALNAAFITTETIGNDVGVRRPDVSTMASFCLLGLGAELDDRWLERIEPQLHLPTSGRRRTSPRRPAR